MKTFTDAYLEAGGNWDQVFHHHIQSKSSIWRTYSQVGDASISVEADVSISVKIPKMGLLRSQIGHFDNIQNQISP